MTTRHRRLRGMVAGVAVAVVLLAMFAYALASPGRGDGLMDFGGRTLDAAPEAYVDRAPTDVEAGKYDVSCGERECEDVDPRVRPQTGEDPRP